MMSSRSWAGPKTTAYPSREAGPPSKTATACRLVFVVGYTGAFLLHLSPPWLPASGQGAFTMWAYAVLLMLAVGGWGGELAEQGRLLTAGPLRAVAWLALGAVGAVALESVGVLASDWLAGVLPGVGAELANDANVGRAIVAFPPWAVLGVLVFAGPVVEEMFFRQFLLTAIADRTRAWVGITVSGVLFGMLHMHSWTLSEWVGIIPHACFGVAAGILFVRTRGNVLFPAALHVLNNLSGIAPSL
ncbi:MULTISPECIES: CPBP family intramembrane glutamic endopeptidase [unclassified Actinomyces]|uniref:CPBP family intramembrane glutamic endopeptidase n=1 Tax=unclassified Actinomyces TaxID=2609248 RepID=UPI000D5A01FC|nr:MULTISPECIES: type II CAAX endopeptidase family protein [unclassified Actinomyces]RAX19766.1 CPBP family intramembrane metalloprotease [Actinomyces sp. Z5]RAX24160.1 CPBP family intramembrane metalloprotease [Actinomyces sp. Z3]